MVPDENLIDVLVPIIPSIFESSTYLIDLNNIDDILKMKLSVKNIGNMFYGDYTTTYPFDKDISLLDLENVANNSAKLLVYENYFFWFSEYYRLYIRSMNKLMYDNDNLPISWRFYIAIMVFYS